MVVSKAGSKAVDAVLYEAEGVGEGCQWPVQRSCVSFVDDNPTGEGGGNNRPKGTARYRNGKYTSSETRSHRMPEPRQKRCTVSIEIYDL